MNENRKFIRTRFITSGTLVCGAQKSPFKLLNLSLKGALLLVDDPDIISLNQTGYLQIELENSPIFLSIQGEMVHREGAKLGFRFLTIDVESMTHLRRIMELNTALVSELDHELSFLKSSQD